MVRRERARSDFGRQLACAASIRAICRESNPFVEPFRRTKTSRMAAMRAAVSGSLARKLPQVSMRVHATSTFCPPNRSRSHRIASKASGAVTIRNLTSSPRNLAFLSLCSNVGTSPRPSLESTQNSSRIACDTGPRMSATKTCPSAAAILA